MMLDRSSGRFGIAVTAAILLLGWLWVQLEGRHPVFRNPEFPQLVARAEAFSRTEPGAHVSGTGPPGVPLLLRGFYDLSGDYRLAGYALTLIGAAVSLLLISFVWRRIGLGAWWCIAAAVMAGLERYFVMCLTAPGTETLRIAIVSLLCLVMCREKWGRRHAFGAGLVAGLGFLVSYRMSVLLLAPLLRSLAEPMAGQRKGGFAGLALAGFLIPASFQFVVRAFTAAAPFPHFGSAFAALQAIDIRFWDYWARWLPLEDTTAEPGMLWFLRAVPRFVSGWFENLGYGLHIWVPLCGGGIWSALRGPFAPAPLRWYLVVHGILFAELLLTPPDVRFGAVFVPFAVFFGMLFIAREVYPRVPGTARVKVPAAAAVFAAMVFGWTQWDLGTFGTMDPYARRNLEVEMQILSAGSDPETSTLDIGGRFYRCTGHVPLPYHGTESAGIGRNTTVTDLENIMGKEHFSFVVITYSPDTERFPDLWSLLGPLPNDADLEPVQLWTDYPRTVLYRFRPEAEGEGNPVRGSASAPG